eukprot:CAMPEP_0173379870 /NCGR_PEP_ID=MMETSP1356-20130122/2677_1 /TAXON_ID=77927 ORGANISM="Hemiselmis virescens, Strain PCC157" /NCGR_SAMPLE_ID=MMETSP1356 /ASSEMBLY_ACC=CAM_ASM_000847 /LENGTH=300 /DNA_ID=CAMNT_0014333297 /DNA_START=51 /DNA_END=950 /DNA_ORIENTATION=+
MAPWWGGQVTLLGMLLMFLGTCTCGQNPLAPGACGPKYVIVSQATPNITDYSVWSFQVNQAYASLHGYAFYVANTTATHYVGNTRDVRWSKIKILQDLLKRDGKSGDLSVVHEPEDSCLASKRKHIFFWIDADAVVMNFDITLQQLMKGREDRDMVVCREGGGGNLANTGLFFLRETPWAADMLTAWWGMGKKRPETLFTPRHEQWALDGLLELPWVASKVELTDPWEFNTVPPFYATTTHSSFVMHLMHEPYGQLREKVFFSVFQALSGTGTHAKILAARVVPNLCRWTVDSYRVSLGD